MNYPEGVPSPLPLQLMPKVCLADSMKWFPNTSNDLTVHTLGLVGESGEFADIVKKAMRGSLPPIEITPTNQTRAMLIEELTDILIYIGNVAALLQVDLEASLNTKREINDERFTEASPSPKLYVAEAKLPKDLRNGDHR